VADRLVLMNQGRIEQVGAPQAVYAQPASAFVARFLGFQNLLPVSQQIDRSNTVQTPIGSFRLADATPQPSSKPAQLLIRPEAASQLALGPLPAQATNGIEGRLLSLAFRGSTYRVAIDVNERANGSGNLAPLIFAVPNTPAVADLLPHLGATVHLLLDATTLTLL
jgi:putative spermidine/putrescine transport system ATP-binding protein